MRTLLTFFSFYVQSDYLFLKHYFILVLTTSFSNIKFCIYQSLGNDRGCILTDSLSLFFSSGNIRLGCSVLGSTFFFFSVIDYILTVLKKEYSGSNKENCPRTWFRRIF